MDVYEAIRARRTIRDFEDRQVGMGTIERIIDAGLKAPTNNHLRQWEFVIVNGKEERANLLRVENMTSRDECEQMLDGFGMTDEVQRNMYREAMPNALQCRMPDTSFFQDPGTVAPTKLIEFPQ